MALVHMNDMLRHAYENQYAVGAFDVVNLDMIQGIIDAAEACRAPVILGIAEPHIAHFNLEMFAPAVEAAARNSAVPVAIHFDHATSLESVAGGIRHGCNSFMIDGSALDFQGNIDLTKDAVKLARACGVHVEAELGYVPETDGDLIYTSASEAAGFVRYTEVDALAVSIGTVHGKFKGKPKLDFTRLRQINEALGIPLVLHGSSGLTDEQFRRLITNGIAKINYFTALTDQAAKLVRDNAKNKNDGYLKLFNGIREAVEEEASRLMRVWGSAGRAAEVLTQCKPWTLVDHVIQFNLPDSEIADAALIIERGNQILSSAPGVREVTFGTSLTQTGTHQYRWVLRLTSAKVAEELKRNSDFNAFLNRYLSRYEQQLYTSSAMQNVSPLAQAS